MGNLSAIISADTTGFKKSVEEAKNILEKFSKAEDDAVKQIKEVSNVSDSQVAAFQRVNRTLSKVSSGAMSTAQSEKALSSQVKELRIQYANLSDTAKNSEFGRAIQRSCEDATKYLNQVRQQLDAVKEKTEETTTTNTSFGNVLGNLKGILGSVGLALGAATTAQAAFEKAINSNQTTADGFAGVMEAAKTSVNQFFYAITTGDFSVFNNGLNNLITRAREAAAAIDQLGNTLMSYNVINAKAQSKITAAKAILYDPNATEEQKKKAEEDLKAAYKEVQESAKVAVGDYERVITTEVEKMGNLSLGDGAIGIIDKWLEMDATKGRDEAKRIADEQYKAYRKAVSDAQKKYTSIEGGSYDEGEVSFDKKGFEKELQQINEQYKDAIVYNTLINKYSDDQLNTLGQQRIAMIQMSDSAAEYAVQMGRVSKAMNGGNKGGGGTTTSTPTRTSIDLTLSPISVGRTEKQIKDEIKAVQQKIENTPDGVVRIALIAHREDLEKELKDFGKNPIKVNIELQANNMDLSGVKGADTSDLTNNPIYVDGSDAIREFGKINDAANQLFNTFKGFENFDEMNFGEQFFTLTNAIFSTIDSISSFVEGIKSAMDTLKQLSAVSSAISKQKIAENATETASNEMKAKSSTKEAAANIFEAHSKIPWVGIAIALGFIATMMATMGKFAGGGIVKGNTTIGDMNLARVNSGEMILNGSQQKHLFNMLNQGGTTESTTNGEVHFKIQGKDLVGVLSNYNKKVGKVL